MLQFNFFKILVTLLIVANWGIDSSKATIRSGTFFGDDSRGDEAQLYLSPYVGRRGSFVAIVLKSDKTLGSIYLVDPSVQGKYNLFEMGVSSSGNIAPKSVIPSMQMEEAFIDKKHFILLTSSNSSENFIFSSKNKKHKIKLNASIYSGSYKGRRQEVSVGSMNFEGEQSVLIRKGVDSNYVARLMLPGVSAFFPVQNKSTGQIEQNAEPTVMFMLYDWGIFCDDQLLVMLNTNTEKVTYLELD